jgi:hypothetical protein
MMDRIYSGLFVAEGSSDAPLADVVETLFFDCGVSVFLSKPDFARLRKVPKDVGSQIDAGLELLGGPIDLVVVHRDADSAGASARMSEIREAASGVGTRFAIVMVIPVRMTEAWLLLDETAIRHVAGNPNGRTDLGLPNVREVERLADPKERLRQCLLRAADATGRRRAAVSRRFPQHRRQLLERIRTDGPVASLAAWRQLISDIETVVDHWSALP